MEAVELWDGVESDTRLDLNRAMESLTDKQREAMTLYLSGYTQADIGAMMGASQQAAQQMIERACSVIRTNI